MPTAPGVDLGRVLRLSANIDHNPTSSPAERGSSRRIFELLRAGVPLTLLMDLACPYGPVSAELYAQEIAG